MNKMNLLTTLMLAFAFVLAQVGSAAAAPAAQTTSIDGTITALTCETDANGVNTFLVTVQGTDGTSQTVRISQQTAIDLQLVTADTNGNVDCSDPAVVQELQNAVNTQVSINSSTVIPDSAGSVNPISTILGMFFGEDATVIDGYHNDGFGFGLIAQALWMSDNVNGDGSLAGDILQAKKTGDYSAFFPDGTENIPTNWGQFKKALSDKHNNLGSVVSGHANQNGTFQPGNGHNNNGNNGNGHGNNGNNGNGHGNGNNKGNGN